MSVLSDLVYVIIYQYLSYDVVTTVLHEAFSEATSSNMISLILLVLLCLNQQGFTMEMDLQHESKTLTGLQKQYTDVITFSAELSSRAELAGGSPIVFDTVITNEGGLYFPNSGQFLCPNADFYIFIWTLRKASVSDLPGMRCISKLTMGGTDLTLGPNTSYRSAASSGAAEMMAVVQCSASPPAAVTVVSVLWSETPGSTSIYQQPDSSFSGFELKTLIGFMVELSDNQVLIPGSRLRFDKVITNIGGHFDVINNYFRCPEHGLYVFSVITYTSDLSTPWSASRLMKDNDVVLQGPITYMATSYYDSGSASTTAVLQCTQGGSVYVEAQETFNFTHNSYGAEFTSFSGFKLYNAASEAVAFTVVMSQNLTIFGEDLVTIAFDEVVTNLGDAFNVSESHFMCPDDEYYLFTWGATAVFGAGVVNLFKDDDNSWLTRLYLTRQNPDDASGTSGSSSTSRIIKCSMDSKFYLKAGGAVNDTVFFEGYTTYKQLFQVTRFLGNGPCNNVIMPCVIYTMMDYDLPVPTLILPMLSNMMDCRLLELA